MSRFGALLMGGVVGRVKRSAEYELLFGANGGENWERKSGQLKATQIA
jgi:hypothetical protein